MVPMDIITGSSGFVGRYLKKALPKAECIPHDLISSSKIESVDNFFFLSSYGNLSWQTDEKKIIQSNVLDIIHIIQNLHWHEVKSFVYVSTSSVKRKVQTVYSRTKKAAEEILLSYAEKYNLPIIIVRPYSITGVGEQKEHLIPTLIRSAITGSKMPFISEPVHDYIDVEDVVSGILTLSEQRCRGIFELGTGNSYSNLQVKEMVERITNNTVMINEVTNMRSYDSSEWVCTNFKARQHGWEPKKSLEDSIRAMVNAYEN